MKQRGLVIRTEGPVATVRIRRSTACEGCHRHAEGCAACSLLGGDRQHTALVRNDIGALPGDTVEIEASDRLILSYAAVVFLFPILLALAFYLVGSSYFGPATLSAGLCACVGFGIAMLGAWLLSAFVARRDPPSHIVRICNAMENGEEYGEDESEGK